jgi:hypothetical protein
MNSLPKQSRRKIPVAPFNLASPVSHRTIPVEQLRPVRPVAPLSGSSPRASQLNAEWKKMLAEKAELDKECIRLRKLLNDRRHGVNQRDASTQTEAAPGPVNISLMRRVRAPQPVEPPVRDVFEDKENVTTNPVVEVVMKTKNAVPNSPVVRSRASPVMLKGSPKASLRRALNSRPILIPPKLPSRRLSMGPSPSASAAESLLDKLLNDDRDFHKCISDNFSKLDGSNEGCISRDSCLVMVSLLLEEKGLRHCSVPKVICSRILKSVAAEPPVSPDGKIGCGPVLRRENASEFVKQALEFIIDQERPSVATSGSKLV